MSYEGSCHCGAVKVAVMRAPADVTSCNCSICHRLGTLWAYYQPAEVTITGETATYRWGDKTIDFHRCAQCGCTTHWSPVAGRDLDRMGINARLLDRAVLAAARVRRLDGASEDWRYLDGFPCARMTDWKLPWDAGCRCDRLRMRITEAPIVTMACHCTGCQRMSASAFSLSILVPASGFAITQGDIEIGGLHGPSRHFHCAHCKTWAFTRPEGMDGFVNLRATMLDDHAWFVPFVETSRAEGFPWATTGASHSFPNIPPPEAFGPIVSDFQQRGARPR